MKAIRYLLMPFYRIWFYALVMVGITLFSPMLFLGTVREQWYKIYFRGARWWGMFVLMGMGFIPKVEHRTKYVPGASYMFVANHVSMVDIMLMLYTANRPFVFVGKKELSNIPLFGFIYKRTCILVDRNDSKSRRNVYKSAQQKINQGYSICIFPEGGVPFDESIVLDTFKDGAFRLAIEHHLPIIPIIFHDNKKRFSYTFFSGGPGKIRALIHAPLATTNYSLEMKRELKAKTHAIILNELENPSL